MGKNYNINQQWKFHLGDTVGADYMGYDDSAWRDVNLPHDWSPQSPPACRKDPCGADNSKEIQPIL